MRILAFDTASGHCAACLWADGEILAKAVKPMRQGQAEYLFVIIDQLLVQTGLEITSLDRIAVTHGPGSYTGVRIGLAAARGFALARSIPIYGVTSLYAIAYGMQKAKCPAPYLSIMETRRKDFYWQFFDGALNALSDIGVSDRAGLIESVKAYTTEKEISLAGDAATRFLETAKDVPFFKQHAHILYPDPCHLAVLVAQDKGERDPIPLYMRPASTTPRAIK